MTQSFYYEIVVICAIDCVSFSPDSGLTGVLGDYLEVKLRANL
jgi:hypothetical protein